MENVRNILVAIDLGESSAQALVEARALAGRFGSALHLLCVVQDPAALSWAPDAETGMLSTLVSQMQQDARAPLEALPPARAAGRS